MYILQKTFVLNKLDRLYQTWLPISCFAILRPTISVQQPSNRCVCCQTIPIPCFSIKILKLATSSSAPDREHGYSNSFTLCRGRTLYPHDMFCFDASAGPTRVYHIPLMCRQANMTKPLHQPNPRYATRQSAGVSRLRTSDRAVPFSRADWLNKLRPVPI